jgi:hypothetical protein
VPIFVWGRRFPSYAPNTAPQKPKAAQIGVDSTRIFEKWYSRRCAESAGKCREPDNSKSSLKHTKCMLDILLQVTRVNSTNVLDEGLRIGRRGRRMNSKVEVSQTRRDYACIENKHSTQLAQSQSVPGRPLLAPIYRWPGLKDPVGFNTNYNVRIRYQLVFQLCL